MKGAAKLEVGSKVQVDGEVWTVTGFEAGQLVLRSQEGRSFRWSIPALIAYKGFRVVKVDQAASTDRTGTPLLESVPKELVRHALDMERHLQEAVSGYRLGQVSLAVDGEPRDGYDPELSSIRERMALKAKELGIGESSLWRKRKQYAELGLIGLVDSRKHKLTVDFPGVDDRVKAVTREVLDGLVDVSNINFTNVRRKVVREVKKRWPDEVVAVPLRKTFNRMAKMYGAGRGFDGSAKARRSIANRPETPYGQRTATRPGEVVLLDTTPLDAYALDTYSMQWVGIQLTLALDLYTRSILAWRFTPVSAKAVDAALLLYDVLMPKGMRPGWPEHARWNYVGVPEGIVIELLNEEGKPDLGLSSIPFLTPEAVFIDQGRMYVSRAFMDACLILGTDIMIARPYMPTDKAHVERVFRTIREDFVQNLPGYKGPDVWSRGKNVEEEAFFFIDEIEELFAEWVASQYHQRPHDGLEFPSAPKMPVSPNQMYEEGVSRAGFVYVAPDESLYYHLLPTEWRTIQHYGIDLHGLRYDGEVLIDYRNKKSPHKGAFAGKWPIRYDPRDLSQVYFEDPLLREWFALPRIGARSEERPFDQKTLAYVKTQFVEFQGRSPNPTELNEAMDDFLQRIEDRYVKGKKERRIAAVRAMRATETARERVRSNVTTSPTPLAPTVPIDLDELEAYEFGSFTPPAAGIPDRVGEPNDALPHADDDDFAI